MNKIPKVRLDILLHQRGLFPSRETARRAIMAGLVSTNGEVLEKPGTMVSEQLPIAIKAPEHSYVSRGGLKLERALTVFPINCDGKVAIDIGASTGGFTDCLLQHGASHVYAVDVGYGQLAWSLRNDDRVTVMERTNFRHINANLFHPKPQLAVMDVSFISTKLLLPKISDVCTEHADIISLIKPQFEAGREYIGKGGIVRNPEVHVQVLLDMLDSVASSGWNCRALTYSPISGGDGNIEFLGWYQRQCGMAYQFTLAEVQHIVKSAWIEVGKGYHPSNE